MRNLKFIFISCFVFLLLWGCMSAADHRKALSSEEADRITSARSSVRSEWV